MSNVSHGRFCQRISIGIPRELCKEIFERFFQGLFEGSVKHLPKQPVKRFLGGNSEELLSKTIKKFSKEVFGEVGGETSR